METDKSFKYACNVPESNKSIAILAAYNMHAALWNMKSFKELTNIGRICWPRKILQTYNDHISFFAIQLRGEVSIN